MSWVFLATVPRCSSTLSRCGVKWVVLGSVGNVLRTWNVQIDDDGILTTAHDHCLHWLVLTRVQFLVRNVGRNIDEVTRTRLIDELQMISPAKARTAPYDVDHGFQFPMMMRAGLGIGLHHHRSRPELLRADSGTRNGFGAGHTGSLRRVGVQLVAPNDTQTVVFPIGFFVGAQILNGLRFPSVVTATNDTIKRLRLEKLQLHASAFMPGAAPPPGQ